MNRKIWLILACLPLILAIKLPFNVKKVTQAAGVVANATHQITEEEEFYIGRAVAANLLSQYTLLKNEECGRYLNLVGGLLAVRSERPQTFGGYHFALLESDEINAFAAPGGIIMLTRGLAKMADNEDELAAVIAHEVCHVVAKDALKAIKSERMKTLGMFTAQQLAGSDNQVFEVFQNSVMDISSTLLQKGYSRGQEKNADLSALDLLAVAGYDPRALLSMLKKMESCEARKAKVFSAHPKSKDRQAYVTEKLSGMAVAEPPSVRVDRFKAFRLKSGL
jgi:beta-barrel assembly-enhancing protease